MGRKGEEKPIEARDLEALKTLVEESGSVAAAARTLSMDPSVLRRILSGEIKQSSHRERWRKKLKVRPAETEALEADEQELLDLYRQIQDAGRRRAAVEQVRQVLHEEAAELKREIAQKEQRLKDLEARLGPTEE